jgi:hypothetical protein
MMSKSRIAFEGLINLGNCCATNFVLCSNEFPEVFRLTSGNRMLGDFPPSSNVTFFTLLSAVAMDNSQANAVSAGKGDLSMSTSR